MASVYGVKAVTSLQVHVWAIHPPPPTLGPVVSSGLKTIFSSYEVSIALEGVSCYSGRTRRVEVGGPYSRLSAPG
jgi:hypothetical protein